MEKRKQRPVLDGEFRMIGENPNLGEIQGLNNKQKLHSCIEPQECVDHHIFQSEDGGWHLWGCIRNTAVGRILYHWRSDELTDSCWEKTGEMIRVDQSSGESINDWHGQEWIQSPYVIKVDDIYYMFYGGHSTGLDKDGNMMDGDICARESSYHIVQHQICLMTSMDGRNWQRIRNAEGNSSVFIGPGEARDPCLIKIGDLWHIYYVGYTVEDKIEEAAVYVRTSKDLYNWSDWKKTHYDLSEKFGSSLWNTECSHVVYREGYYYLFRTEDYASSKTHVFRSEDPYDFGLGDAEQYYVGQISVGAPEIIIGENGQEYITSNHNLTGGTMMCKLKWIND